MALLCIHGLMNWYKFFKFGTHIYLVSLLIPFIFVLLSICFLRYQLDSWHVNWVDCLIYWVHISLESGHCDLLCIHSLGKDNWQGIHWSQHTDVLGSLWILLLLIISKCCIILSWMQPIDTCCMTTMCYYTLRSTKFKVGILVSPCLSVCPYLCKCPLGLGFVSCIMLWVCSYWETSVCGQNHVRSVSSTSEGVSHAKFISKFQNFNFWQILWICDFDFVLFWLWVQYDLYG